MKHDDDRLNMWFSLMISIIVHVAVILLVPITLTHHVAVYPVEFGEISQTFASTRQGSPTGTPLPAPPKRQDTTVQEKALERQQEPLPKPAPKAPEPPAKEIQAPVKEIEKPPEPEIVPTKPEPESVAVKPKPETVAAKPEPVPDDVGRVLTGESDETIPIPEANTASAETGNKGLPAQEPKASPGASGSAKGSGDTKGESFTTDETGKDEETSAKGKAQDTEAGPEKPKGHQFGTGESLAINSAPPRYPKGAQNVDLMGDVKLEVAIDKDGKVLGVDVSQASSHSELDEQARMTVLALWKFKGINWPYKIRVTVSFRGEADVDVQFGGVTVLDD